MQLEGVCQAILGNGPGFGKRGLNGTGLVDPGQALEQVGVDHLIDGGGRARGGIEMRWLQRDADNDVVTLGEGRSGRSDDEDSGQGNTLQDSAAAHGDSSRVTYP